MKKFIVRIARLYAPFKKRLLVSLSLLMTIELVSLAMPYVYGRLVNAASGHKLAGVALFSFGCLAVFLTSRGVDWIRDKFTLALELDTNLHVSNQTISKILEYSVGQHHNENSGIKQQVINRGERAIQEATSRILFDLAPMVLGSIITIIILLAYNPTIGLITLLGAVIYITVIRQANSKFIKQIRLIRKKNRATGKIYNELVRNVELVKLNAQEAKAQGEYSVALKDSNTFETNTWLAVIRYWFTSGLIVTFTMIVVYFVCGAMVCYDAISIGAMVACIGWANPVLSRVTQAGNIQRAIMGWRADIERYFVMMDIPCDIIVMENPVRPDRYLGRIVFENVSFTYPRRKTQVAKDKDHIVDIDGDGDDGEDSGKKKPGESEKEVDPAIEEVSFTLEQGGRYAVVGESGSGKSTIRHLMLRSYDPQKGRILIDGIDLRTLDLRHYLEHVGVVDQDVLLFDRSLRDNIVWARDDKLPVLTEPQLLDICQQACIDRFFCRLEHGLETEIGERGVKLSGGERQRVGIARALAKHPSILVFDEATSHLDSVNEADITESIEKASVGRTTIIIAHRLSTILSADKILVLDKGKLVGIGTHQELYAGCDKYKALVGNQIMALEKLHFGLVGSGGAKIAQP